MDSGTRLAIENALTVLGDYDPPGVSEARLTEVAYDALRNLLVLDPEED